MVPFPAGQASRALGPTGGYPYLHPPRFDPLKAACGDSDLPESLRRHPNVLGLCERFTNRSSRKVPQPRLEHPASIGRVRRPPQKPVMFPANLDQLDQQLT